MLTENDNKNPYSSEDATTRRSLLLLLLLLLLLNHTLGTEYKKHSKYIITAYRSCVKPIPYTWTLELQYIT